MGEPVAVGNATRSASWLEQLAKKPWKSAGLFCVLGLLPGLGALTAPLLLAFDDKYATLQNPVIAHGWSGLWSHLILPFTAADPSAYDATVHWSPLTFLSLGLDHFLFSWAGSETGGFAPWGFRLMTGVYHGLCGWFVWRLGTRLTGRREATFAAALAFLFHPTACESVCWIIERNNVLPALFGLWATDVYTDTADGAAPSFPRALGAAGLLLAAQLCKGVGLCWFPIILAWDFLLLHETSWRRRAARWGLLALPAALTVWVTLTSHQKMLLPPLGQPPFGPWLYWLYLQFRYLGLMAWPGALSVFYHVSPLGVDWLTMCLGLAGVALVVWWARYVGVPWARLGLLAVWIVAAVGPVINPFTTTAFPLADRFVYPALPAFVILVAEAFARTAERLQLAWTRWLAAAAIPALLFLSWNRSQVWRSEPALFGDAAQKEGHSAFGHFYLADYLVHRSTQTADPRHKLRLQKQGLEYFEQALECDDFDRLVRPLASLLKFNMVYAAQGERDRARALCLRVWETPRPERPKEEGAKAEAAAFLAKYALEDGEREEALAWCERGLKLDRKHAELLGLRKAALAH